MGSSTEHGALCKSQQEHKGLRKGGAGGHLRVEEVCAEKLQVDHLHALHPCHYYAESWLFMFLSTPSLEMTRSQKG